MTLMIEVPTLDKEGKKIEDKDIKKILEEEEGKREEEDFTPIDF